MQSPTPHSLVIYTQYEIHQRRKDGMISGSPILTQPKVGAIHCESKELAEELIAKVNTLIEDFIKNSGTSGDTK
jgi:hypothetical protein